MTGTVAAKTALNKGLITLGFSNLLQEDPVQKADHDQNKAFYLFIFIILPILFLNFT